MSKSELEADWKRFRNMVPELRERYLESVNRELLREFSEPDKTPTEIFWAIQERTKKEAKILRQCLDGHSRSSMSMFLMKMYAEGMITEDDLSGFSEQTRKWIPVEEKIGAVQSLIEPQ